MKKHILSAINLDLFIKYQNGNLVNDFNNYSPSRYINIDKYSETKIYKTVDKNNKEELIYLKKIISAYENFENFLNDDDSIIDHTYLWDIVCAPNKQLFTQGINLIIIRLPENDITNNTEILCPSNHYSVEIYESRKPTVILLKINDFYEPIYLYTSAKNKIKISKEFKERDPYLSTNIRNILKFLSSQLFFALKLEHKTFLSKLYLSMKHL